MNDAHRIASSFPNSPGGVILFADSLENFMQTYAAALGRQAATLAQQRTGWILEFAGASAFNTVGNNSVERLGAWMNLSRKVSTTDMFTFTARYMWHNSDTLINNFDAGLAYTKNKGKYNFSLEYMLRWSSAQLQGSSVKRNDFSYRLAVQAAYMLSSKISINVSLGKDFDTPYISSNAFFSLLGFNYTLFNRQIPAPATSGNSTNK